MPNRGTGDPWLKHPTWALAVRYWRQQQQRRRLTCPRCGRPIDTRPGTPWSLDVGHIVDRRTARALGWNVEQANAIPNTQPEHRRCNRQAGARLGNSLRPTRTARPTEADEW